MKKIVFYSTAILLSPLVASAQDLTLGGDFSLSTSWDRGKVNGVVTNDQVSSGFEGNVMLSYEAENFGGSLELNVFDASPAIFFDDAEVYLAGNFGKLAISTDAEDYFGLKDTQDDELETATHFGVPNITEFTNGDIYENVVAYVSPSFNNVKFVIGTNLDVDRFAGEIQPLVAGVVYESEAFSADFFFNNLDDFSFSSQAEIGMFDFGISASKLDGFDNTVRFTTVALSLGVAVTEYDRFYLSLKRIPGERFDGTNVNSIGYRYQELGYFFLYEGTVNDLTLEVGAGNRGGEFERFVPSTGVTDFISTRDNFQFVSKVTYAASDNFEFWGLLQRGVNEIPTSNSEFSSDRIAFGSEITF